MAEEVDTEPKKMTTQERIEFTASALVAKLMPAIERIVQNAVEGNNDVVLGYLDVLAEAQSGAAGEYSSYLKGQLKAARAKRRARKQ